MPFIQWDEGFATGIHQFDKHHQHLIDLLNDSYDNFICGAPEDSFGTILDELVDYAIYHFAAEETWMHDVSYPKLLDHKHEHDSFFQSVLKMQDDFHSGQSNISLDILNFLRTWLHNHILELDVEYGSYRSNLTQ